MLAQQPISDQELFNQLYALAQQHFPNETAKAESWLQEQLVKYGIARAQFTGQQLVQSPWVWLAGGMLVGWLFFRR